MEKYKKQSLKLAKNSILSYFWKANIEDYTPSNKELSKIKSCFVTLRENWELRGCMWSLKSTNKLYEDIIKNAKSAAFSDPRFPPIKFNELQKNNFEIEITILSNMEDKQFENIKKMKEFLEKNKPWVLIKYGMKQATYLPSVWEKLPNVDNFINRLLIKANIRKENFQDNFQDFDIKIYFWDKFSNNFQSI